MKVSIAAWMALTAALGLSACGGSEHHRGPPGPATGTLSLDWTIDGHTDQLDCADFNADRLELVIYDERDGSIVDKSEPYCESFGTTVELPNGHYYADATLVDQFDASATLTEPIDDIVIIGGTDLNIGIDFPLDSFL